MVPFGGYLMPVQYSDLSIVESHKWTREKASLFDVGHMVQNRIGGTGAEAFLSTITPSSFADLRPHQSTLSAILHPGTGGIIDDTVIVRLGPEVSSTWTSIDNHSFYMVTNAGCRQKDLEFFRQTVNQWNQSNEDQVTHHVLHRQGLIALQGPLSAEILAKHLETPNIDELNGILFGHSKFLRLRLSSGQLSQPVLVSRGGYTGEDGFEISITAAETPSVVEALLQSAGKDKLRLAGLGARDSLRLEAGMCLYGHDLDDSTTPVEAGLSWIIGKDRRSRGGFNGDEVILKQLVPASKGGNGVSRRRVGFIVEGAPAREGARITDEAGKDIGHVTSGCPSPTLNKNIAMGYIQDGYHKAGTEVQIVVRGKPRAAKVTKMPFVPSKYWKGGASPG
ncbi:MAG: Aminomethyltransferase, mitochondrial [Bathelium mastoideum]|nr:MAG: Aminomethyltransferase, mitochondrial [Bathelium mastoideum]